MEKSGIKTSVIVAIVILAALLGWWYMSGGSSNIPNTGTPVNEQQNQLSDTSVTPAQRSADALMTQGNSDTSLNQDTASIDSQLGGLGTDTNNAAQGVDSPVQTL